MTKRVNKTRGKKIEKNNPQEQTIAPWVRMKSALLIIAIISILLVILVAWQTIPYVGWRDGILSGLLFGGMIWAVFLISQVFFRWLRR